MNKKEWKFLFDNSPFIYASEDDRIENEMSNNKKKLTSKFVFRISIQKNLRHKINQGRYQ